MAESNMLLVPETGTETIKEMLYAQQQLLQQLYTELEEEREASATAASEALSMILRLQGEKASLMMEANQYKRIAEEKMCHAEEALAAFEDLIYQREMEIASLEYQVQAYRYRLLSMGCNDLGVYENIFPENLLMHRNDALLGEKGINSNVRRLKSLPQIPVQDGNHRKGAFERNISAATSPDSIQSIMSENASQEINTSEKKSGCSAGGDINSYWEQIKKLDEQVKEISDSKDSGRYKSTFNKGETWSPSLFSQISVGTFDKGQENSQGKEDIVNSPSSSSVQDIFEVPQTANSLKVCEPRKMERHKLTLEIKNRHGKPDPVSEDMIKSPNEDKIDRVKKILVSPGYEKKLSKPRDATSVDCNVSLFPAIGGGDFQAEHQQLCRRIEQLERERNNAREEIIAGGEGEMNLLKEISEQLKSIQSEMRNLRAKKSPLPDGPSLDPLRDAMIYFWL